ncbi:hypothetical protein L1987_06911 [Smallanthus sonchifolius]|uniref:Uncharacterized protein n=1 Tax=Smallanthus sonchifolius TaxID=185202 RepID=A0ACB9JZU1_9ASTR|nr:hypothetical protein L1987_06911 [Smallanthus sonchifolius]
MRVEKKPPTSLKSKFHREASTWQNANHNVQNWILKDLDQFHFWVMENVKGNEIDLRLALGVTNQRVETLKMMVK